MARMRIARSKLYRKRRRMGVPYGRRAPLRGMRGLFSPLRGAVRGLYTYKQVTLNNPSFGPIAVLAGAGDYLAAYNFQLSQVGGNLGAFTSLYDQYKIRKVVWTLYPKFNSSDIQFSGSNGGELPMVTTCIDYDDSNPPPGIAEIVQRQNAKIHRAGRPITRVLKPCANFVVDASTGALSNKQSPWLDLTNNTVPHYGIKLGIQASPVNQNYDVVVKYYLAFRQVR